MNNKYLLIILANRKNKQILSFIRAGIHRFPSESTGKSFDFPIKILYVPRQID